VLYQKGGNIPRALDLCFRAELLDLLASITDALVARRAPPAARSDSAKG
jgi:hypothetical protein